MEVVGIGDPSRTPNSESKVLKALAEIDDPRSLAFHSVAWLGLRSDRQSDGEADFVIADGACGILVIEVKGGGIDLNSGQWFSTDAKGIRHQIKNPFEQAKASKHALLRYIKSVDPSLARRISFSHAVLFPDITCDFDALGPACPKAIVIDRLGLRDLSASLKSVFAHWGAAAGPTAADRGQLRGLLAPTIAVSRKLRDVVADTEKEILRLTTDQIQAMQGMRRNRRLIVLGGAGTGKTILAVERARQLREAGSRTLLVCFNRPLMDRLRSELKGSSVDVETYHTLCSRVLEKARTKYPSPQDERWWRESSGEALFEASSSLDIAYDAILVDEAQDFDGSWLEALECLLSSRADSVFIVHGDGHQELWSRGWGEWCTSKSWPIFELSTNCRNSSQIAAHVAKVFADPVCCLGAQGPEPVFHKLDIAKHGLVEVVGLIGQLLREGRLEPSQIAVLSSSRDIASSLHSTFVEDIPFGPIGTRGLVADTIHRFKGLEATCVVVILSGDAEEEDRRMLRYVAYSRASSVLHVFSKRGGAA